MSIKKEQLKHFFNNLIYFLMLWIVFSVFFNGANSVFCKAEAKTIEQRVKTLRLKDNVVKQVYISHRGGVINFPSKPSKVVLGNSSSFAIEYIKNDLVVSPLLSNARAHIFVYVGSRRFNLDVISSKKGSTVLQVRDYFEASREVPYVQQ